MSKTDLLFKQDLIFRDHQLKKIQITYVFKLRSLLEVWDFSKTFCEHPNPSKKTQISRTPCLII